MQELAEHGEVKLRNGIVMHVSSHNETSFPLRPSPDNQPDPGPVEQQEADPKKDDGKVLPHHERRSGKANYQRFRSRHGKTAEASVEDDTSANAGTEADKSSATTAEGSVARRRASRTRKKDSAGQTAEPSEGRGRDAVPNRNYPIFPILMGLSMLTGLLFSGPITGLLLRLKGREQVGDPLPNSGSPITLTRVDERLLQDAQRAVLERFDSYIPADAPCHKVDAKISQELTSSEFLTKVRGYYHPDMPGYYLPISNELILAPYLADDRLHIAMHEFCHCYTHLQFRKALLQSPLYTILNESLTDHLVEKHLRSGGRVIHTKWKREAQKLEEAVGEVTLMRAYFSGNKAAIRKISRAAVDIYPKKTTTAAWSAVETLGDKKDGRKLAECFVGASLLAEGKLPPDDGRCFAGSRLPVRCFSFIDDKQKAAILKQAKQARDQLGAEKFDQAFYNFDKKAAEQAMRNVREDLLANWQPVMAGKTFEEQLNDRL